jgi:hypothetical protein
MGLLRFMRIGFPVPDFTAHLVGTFEIICGFLVLVGLVTKLASIPLLIVILTAIATTKIPELWHPNQGFWFMVSDARTDFAKTMSLLFLISVGARIMISRRLVLGRRRRRLSWSPKMPAPAGGLYIWKGRSKGLRGYGGGLKATSSCARWGRPKSKGRAEPLNVYEVTGLGLIASIRRECFDHVFVSGEGHLRRILKAYASYYKEVRTHLSLDKNAPDFRRALPLGDIAAIPILGWAASSIRPALGFE